MSAQWLIGAALAVLARSPAQHGSGRGCGRAETTVQLEDCLARELAAEDKRLRRAELRVHTELAPAAAARFDSAARIWRAYRDAECRGVREANSGGTIAGPAVLGCHLELARARRVSVARVYPGATSR